MHTGMYIIYIYRLAGKELTKTQALQHASLSFRLLQNNSCVLSSSVCLLAFCMPASLYLFCMHFYTLCLLASEFFSLHILGNNFLALLFCTVLFSSCEGCSETVMGHQISGKKKENDVCHSWTIGFEPEPTSPGLGTTGSKA